MSAAKVVTVRLPKELLERVDALVDAGFDNRSDALRTLVESGIDKDAIHLRLQDLEAKLSRLMHVAEKQYQLTYVAAMIAKDGKNEIDAKIPEFRSLANQSLTTSLVDKFGE